MDSAGGIYVVDAGKHNIQKFEFVSSGLVLSSPTPGTAGVVNTLDGSGATPGATVHLVFGTESGSTDVPGCPGEAVGIAIAKIEGNAVADGSGNATFSPLVPASAAGLTVRLQAVEQSSCRVSELVVHSFP